MSPSGQHPVSATGRRSRRGIVRAMLATASLVAATAFLGGCNAKKEEKKKAVPDTILITPLPPPPPPPPPPPKVEPPPEPEKQEMVKEEPIPEEEPKPEEAPEPSPDLGTNIAGDGPGINGLGRGNGNGNGPGGNGRGGKGVNQRRVYAAQLQKSLAAALGRNPKTRTAAYDVTARIWFDHSGQVTRASVSGDITPPVKQSIESDVLANYAGVGPPPADTPMPYVVKFKSVRP